MSDVLTKALAEHGEAIKMFHEETSEKVSEMKSRLTNLEQAFTKGMKNAGSGGPAPLTFDLSGMLQSPGFKAVRDKVKGANAGAPLGEISIKALVNYSGDFDSNDSTFATRPNVFPMQPGQALRPLRLLNVMPSRPVTSNAIEYVQLTWTGEADTQVQEGDEKAEMTFEGQLVTAHVATIAVHTTASAQVLDDAESLQATIQRVLTHSVLSAVETGLITGSGTGNRIEGLYTQAEYIGTGQDALADRIGSAITEMEDEGYQVDVILMNSKDWFRISTIKDANGNYIYGNPANPAQPTLWNRPVITSPSIPEFSALIGDTSRTNVLDRMQPTVYISRDHKDYRTRNLVLILVEARVGMELYDTKAFRRVNLELNSDGG